jgi:hypothetical protein
MLVTADLAHSAVPVVLSDMPEVDRGHGMSDSKQWIAILEPWGMGDVCIALHLARRLRGSGYRVALICDPRWSTWLNGSDEVDCVVELHAPWTDRYAKYAYWKYHPSKLTVPRRVLRDLAPCYVCELRGDIRNLALIKLIARSRVASLFRQSFPNRYECVESMSNRLGLTPSTAKGITTPPGSHVTCFFGAGWRNRRVPLAKAQEIVMALLRRGYTATVLLQPEDPEEEWAEIATASCDRVQALKLSLQDGLVWLRRSGVCVSTDSGWLHVAYLYSIPRVGLFAFRTHEEWAPPGTQVVLARHAPPKELRYKRDAASMPLEDLDVSTVLRAVSHLAPSEPYGDPEPFAAGGRPGPTDLNCH